MAISVPRLRASLFGLTLVCFLLPFVTVACPAGQFTFSGIQLALGTTVEEQQLLGPPRVRRIDGDPLALVALGCAALGTGMAFVSGGWGRVLTAATGVTGLVFLFAVKNKIDGQVATQAVALLRVWYGIGYWLALSGFGAVFLTSVVLETKAAELRSLRARMWKGLEGVTSPPTAADEVLNNEAVVRMIGAGLGGKVVIQKIAYSRCSFALSSSDLVQLRESGVSEDIIASMLSNQARRGGSRLDSTGHVEV